MFLHWCLSLHEHTSAIYCVKYFSENINFQMKICGVFLIFPQNMRCEYLLEMPDNKAVLSSTKQFLL